MATPTIYQQSEIVRKKMFPKWFAADFNVLTDFFDKSDVERVGERDFRIPFQKTKGGQSGHVELQGGDYGRGNSPTGDVMLQSFFTTRRNYELTELEIAATETNATAIKSPFLDCIANGLQAHENFLDQTYHQNGTALLATATAHSSASGVSVYTFETGFGTQLLEVGQKYTIYETTAATIRSSQLYVTQINTQARTATMSGIVPSAAATDKFMMDGVSGSNPAGPRGLKYWVSSATTGTTAAIDRSLNNQIIAKSVDGSGGFTPEVVLALYHRILKDRGKVAEGMMGISGVAQEGYVVANMLALQTQLISGTTVDAFDRLPKLKGKKSFMWGGVPIWVDIHQSDTEVPFIIPSLWGRARLRQPGFVELPGTTGASARFYRIPGGSGGPSAAVWFGFQNADDIYCTDPGAQGVVTGCPLGTLYA